MHEKIKEIISEIKSKQISKLIKGIALEHKDALLTSPAACGNHHAYEGGLLDHLHSTAKLAGKICDHYPDVKINRDIAVAGAFLHDIGKIECYRKIEEVDSKQRYKSTPSSLLFHHIPIGYYIVRAMSDRLKLKISEEELFGILHIIISHHGRKEYSSPRTPRTDEARIAAQADFIDAYLSADQNAKGMYGK